MRTLEVKDIVVHYGLVQALHGVGFRIEAGKIVALIGSNGAGKSTTLKALMGLKRLTSGALLLDGQPIEGTHAAQRVGLGLALSPEGRRLFPRMSVWENLMVGAHTVRSSAQRTRSLDLVYELFPRVKERREQLAGSLSGGEQQMVAIGRALMAQPKVLLLDEPLLGLSPLIQAHLIKATKVIQKETGISVIISEQYARPVFPIVDYAYILENGAAVMEGTRDELMDNPDVKSAYFGIS